MAHPLRDRGLPPAAGGSSGVGGFDFPTPRLSAAQVTRRGKAREKVLLVDPDRELFLQVLAQVVERFSWLCYAYAAYGQANAVRP